MAHNIITGTPVSPVVHQFRKNICNACPSRIKSTGTCGIFLIGGTAHCPGCGNPMFDKCGCITNLKTKYLEERCPGGKW